MGEFEFWIIQVLIFNKSSNYYKIILIFIIDYNNNLLYYYWFSVTNNFTDRFLLHGRLIEIT